MAVDNTFMVRKIQSKENLFAVYCAFTNSPLVVCDPETFNDQVWLFETEELLQGFAKPYMEEKKLLLRGIQLKNKDFLKFFSTLFLIGVNEVMYVDESGKTPLALETIVRRPDYSKLKPEQVPISNPNLQLTGLYFMQEAQRQIPQEEKTGLTDLQEELFANMVKARYIVPVKVADGPESLAEKLKQKKYGMPGLKDKDGNTYQPVFTDVAEFEKFARDKGLAAVGLPFINLERILSKEAKGFMLNPLGFKILMHRALLTQLPKRFQ